MLAHLRANLLLLASTVVICCGAYPLALLVIGQSLLSNQANGSLVVDKAGRPIGSRLIAQEFKGDEYFQPRPSAVGYNAAAAGGSNWGASNPLLRERVARTLGPIVKYKSGPSKGKTAAADIATWARARPDLLAEWAKAHPDEPITSDDEIAAAFFGSWRQDHPTVELDDVPADMVMASGSGLDPHITLKNAQYQLDRVASKWAEISNGDPAKVRTEIEQILKQHTTAPMGGLAGVDLVAVMDVNLALRERYQPKN